MTIPPGLRMAAEQKIRRAVELARVLAGETNKDNGGTSQGGGGTSQGTGGGTDSGTDGGGDNVSL